MNENQPKLNNSSPKEGTGWWKPGVEIFTQVSGWIVTPIVLALIFGKMLDKYYGTEPWIFLSLALFGFLISCFGIFRVITRYIEKIKELEKDGK